MRHSRIATAVLLSLLLATAAGAYPVFNAQLFQPSIFGGNTVSIEDGGTLCRLGYGGGILFNYAWKPVKLLSKPEPTRMVINDLLTADVVAGFGPARWVSMGFDLPIHFWALGRKFGGLRGGTGLSGNRSLTTLGDLRFEVKFRALRQDEHWLNLAIAPYVVFPTGFSGFFLSDGQVTGGGTLILEHDFGPLNVVLNGGYLFRKPTTLLTSHVGGTWRAGAALSHRFDDGVSISAEYFANWTQSSLPRRFKGDAMEVLGTLRYEFGKDRPRLVMAGGAGLTNGVGCPTARGVLGVDYYHCPPPPSAFGRLEVRVVDKNDKPLPASLAFAAPLAKTVETGADGRWFADVPPGDYPVTATKEGYSLEKGKGAVARGKTALVVLKLTKMVPVPPTLLTIVVRDKSTGAKIESSAAYVDGKDQRVLAIPAGEVTRDWKPGPATFDVTAVGYEHVEVSTNVVEHQTTTVQVFLRPAYTIQFRILFDFDKSVIRPDAASELQKALDWIHRFKEYRNIIIQGHCSYEGSDEYNLKLAERRAKAVKAWLARHGVSAAKMTVDPRGKREPIATNDTEEGRQLNRRAVLVMEEK